MSYIIENTSLLRNKTCKDTSILVEEEKVSSIKSSFQQYNYMKMDGEPFIMTPTHVIYSDIPLDWGFSEQKSFFLEEHLLKGCTTFLTSVDVRYEHLLQTKIKNLKMSLINSPIDYIIGIRIRTNLLHSNFMRICKKEKIPAIFIEIYKEEDLKDIAWGWIREALFPYNSPLIPMFLMESEKEKKRLRQIWLDTMKREKIPFIEEELIDGRPISYRNLSKIGIIPLKGNIQQGGEVSYNFYRKSQKIRYVDELQLFQQHYDRLEITVHRGTVIRAGDFILFRPGYGEHVGITKPAFYHSDNY